MVRRMTQTKRAVVINKSNQVLEARTVLPRILVETTTKEILCSLRL